MAKIKNNAEIKLEITKRVLEEVAKFEIKIQARYQGKFNRMHEKLNWIMDSSVMYDADHLKMAEMAIEQNRSYATLARSILRTMMK